MQQLLRPLVVDSACTLVWIVTLNSARTSASTISMPRRTASKPSTCSSTIFLREAFFAARIAFSSSCSRAELTMSLARHRTVWVFKARFAATK